MPATPPDSTVTTAAASEPAFCAIIPTHNHDRALPAIVGTLQRAGLPVIIVDDGSAAPQSNNIALLHAPENDIEVIRLDRNGGKGEAVITGFRRAHFRGFTHAIQVDADGQHDLSQLPALMAAAKDSPHALISGRPVYDQSMPLGRRIGRWITHVWVWIETLSFQIADSMCGFRVYPLASTWRLVEEERIGRHMDFDTEIMVRLFWRGVPTIHIPVRVVYPPGNTSNFHLLKDNVRVSWMHTRLFFTMLSRLPSIVRHRPAAKVAPQAARPTHWANLQENGAVIGIKSLALIYRLLGRRICLAVVGAVVGYFYIVDGARRGYSLQYLTRVHAAKGWPVPTWWDGYRHFSSFGAKSLDAFIAWCDPDRIAELKVTGAAPLDELGATGQGVLLIVSHLGNSELSRATLRNRFKRDVYALLHTRHAHFYNGVIRAMRPDAANHTIEVDQIGPETAIALRDRVEKGDWIAIAGDRTPLSGSVRSVRVPFLGADAPFSTGAYLLASIMGCPVYLMFCLRTGDTHEVTFEKFADRITLPRGKRDEALADYAASYARRLEHYCIEAPTQFYNFYDFWAAGDEGLGSGDTKPTTAAHGL
jgi:predicted LPLAT superfamily acyltransferase